MFAHGSVADGIRWGSVVLFFIVIVNNLFYLFLKTNNVCYNKLILGGTYENSYKARRF